MCYNVFQILLLGRTKADYMLGIEVLFCTISLDVFNHLKEKQGQKSNSLNQRCVFLSCLLLASEMLPRLRCPGVVLLARLCPHVEAGSAASEASSLCEWPSISAKHH